MLRISRATREILAARYPFCAILKPAIFRRSQRGLAHCSQPRHGPSARHADLRHADQCQLVDADSFPDQRNAQRSARSTVSRSPRVASTPRWSNHSDEHGGSTDTLRPIAHPRANICAYVDLAPTGSFPGRSPRQLLAQGNGSTSPRKLSDTTVSLPAGLGPALLTAVSYLHAHGAVSKLDGRRVSPQKIPPAMHLLLSPFSGSFLLRRVRLISARGCHGYCYSVVLDRRCGRCRRHRHHACTNRSRAVGPCPPG